MSEKNRTAISFVINALAFVGEVIGFVICIPSQRWGLVKYYTQDSNIVAMAACGALAVCELLRLLGRTERVPRWAVVLKYIATCMVTVTFLVVVFVLAPSYGGGRQYRYMLFDGAMLYHHFLCPVLAFISFVFFETDIDIKMKDTLLALLPTVIYAIVTVILNILRVMHGPYPFLRVYEQPAFMSVVWFVAIIGGAYGIAWLIRAIRNRMAALWGK